LVAALRTATGREPLVAGKPEPALHAEAVGRTGAQRPLVVGDRLDTDVLGAVRAGAPSLLVLTGVIDLPALLAAPAGSRPSYVAADLRGLLHPQPDVVVDGDTARCGAATAHRSGDVVTVEPAAAADAMAHGVAALRAVCALAWAAVDRGGVVPAVEGL
jgi:hypothetical protein